MFLSGIVHIDAVQNQLAEICRQQRVKHLYVFGSVLTDRFDREHKSDLDFFVEMDGTLRPLQRGEHLLQLWNALESLFERPVDLLTDSSLHNPYLKREIEATKILIYDGASEEVFV